MDIWQNLVQLLWNPWKARTEVSEVLSIADSEVHDKTWNSRVQIFQERRALHLNISPKLSLGSQMHDLQYDEEIQKLEIQAPQKESKFEAFLTWNDTSVPFDFTLGTIIFTKRLHFVRCKPNLRFLGSWNSIPTTSSISLGLAPFMLKPVNPVLLKVSVYFKSSAASSFLLSSCLHQYSKPFNNHMYSIISTVCTSIIVMLEQIAQHGKKMRGLSLTKGASLGPSKWSSKYFSKSMLSPITWPLCSSDGT